MGRQPSLRKLKKYTLNLDQDAVERIQAALRKVPGRPSLSSMISQQLPQLADALEEMMRAVEASNVDAILGVVTDLTDDMNSKAIEMRREVKAKKRTIDSLPQESKVLDVPASEPRKQKKLA